jgi:hypothetical protein
LYAKLKNIFNYPTVDMNVAPKSATYHTADRCVQPMHMDIN